MVAFFGLGLQELIILGGVGLVAVVGIVLAVVLSHQRPNDRGEAE